MVPTKNEATLALIYAQTRHFDSQNEHVRLFVQSLQKRPHCALFHNLPNSRKPRQKSDFGQKEYFSPYIVFQIVRYMVLGLGQAFLITVPHGLHNKTRKCHRALLFLFLLMRPYEHVQYPTTRRVDQYNNNGITTKYTVKLYHHTWYLFLAAPYIFQSGNFPHKRLASTQP